MSKLYNALAVVAIANLLAVGGLLGLLASTGRLAPDRVDAALRALRGEAPASQPAEAEVQHAETVSTAPARQQSAEEIREQQRHEQLRRATLDRAMRDLAAQRELLDQVLHEVITRQEQLEKQQQDWLAQRAKLRSEAQDDGFEKELEFVAGLPPKQAKEHLVKTWKQSQADAVRLVGGLKPSKAKELLSQLKTPEELDIMHQLLVELREQDVDQLVPGQGGPQASGGSAQQP